MSNALDAYLAAVQNFQECATASMDNLVKAKEAYEGAVGASAEIRQILNLQGDTLDSVMTKLQEAVSVHLVRKGEATKVIETPLEKNIPELLRLVEESAPKKASESAAENADQEGTREMPAPKKKMWQL
jgi:predicted RNase H-like HicB family nuclease